MTVGIEAIKARLLRSMGDDWTAAESALVSTDAADADWIDLTNRLIRDRHFGCFEHQAATFTIGAPIFIARQFMRHRSFSFNELSGRYKDFRNQPIYIHALFSDLHADLYADHGIAALFELTADDYRLLRNDCLPREVARQILPLATMTRFVVTGNLRAWAHFISLRDDEHAQEEIQHLAKQIRAQLAELWPVSSKIFGEQVYI